MHRGTCSSPILIEDSEEEVIELCNSSSFSTRLSDPPHMDTCQDYYDSTSHKRKRDEIRTDYSDAFVQGSSSTPLVMQSPGESKKARKRRRRLERQAVGAAEMLARAQEQQRWYHQMSSVLYDPGVPTSAVPSGGGRANPMPNLNLNMSNFNMTMNMFTNLNMMPPVYSGADENVLMPPYVQPEMTRASDWVSAMALAGSLPDPSVFPNQYQWPPPHDHSHDLPMQHAQFGTMIDQIPPSPSLSPSSLSPPALLERVSSPTGPVTNPLPLAQAIHNGNAHPNTPKKRHQVFAQTIGMKPDNEPHSKHGVFRFSRGNLSFFSPHSVKILGNAKDPNPHSYIPNPACTIVMEQLPKTYRTIDFVKSWAKTSSGVLPVCIFADAPSAKALVEFPSAKLARKAWESPRLGAEYAGLKTRLLKGKPRVDQIRVWWYRVEGVGAGAGVGEIEEGEIEDDQVDGGGGEEQRHHGQQEQGHHRQQVQSQTGHQQPPLQPRQGQVQVQQEPQRQRESKKARKARLAREKQATKENTMMMMMMQPQNQNQDQDQGSYHDRNRLGGIKGGAVVQSTGVPEPFTSPCSSRDEHHRSLARSASPEIPARIANGGSETRPQDHVDDAIHPRGASPARQLRGPPLGKPWHSGKTWTWGISGNTKHVDTAVEAVESSTTSTGERGESRCRRWPRNGDDPAEFVLDSSVVGDGDSIASSREVSVVRQPRGSGDPANVDDGAPALGTGPVPCVREVMIPGTAIPATVKPPSPPPLTTTIRSTVDLPGTALRKAHPHHRPTGTSSPVDVSKATKVTLPPLSTLTRVTSGAGTSIPSSRSSPQRSAPSVSPTQSIQSGSSLPSPVQVIPASEPAITGPSSGRAKITSVIPSRPCSVSTPSPATTTTTPVFAPEITPALVSVPGARDGRARQPSTAGPERAPSGAANGVVNGGAMSASTSLAELKRALMAKQKELEEKIAKSKSEMSRLKGNPKGPSNEAESPAMETISGDNSNAMEDRLRKLVLQSQKSRSRGTEQPPSSASSPALLSPLVGTENVVHTTSTVQSFSLEELAVSFITETISTLKQSSSPGAGGVDVSPTASVPSVSSTSVSVSRSQSQPRPQSQSLSQAQSQAPTTTPPLVNVNGNGNIKEELAARQKRLEQYIAESKSLMTQLMLARTKQEKDRLLALMREKTRLMDEEKEKMANVSNGATGPTSGARGAGVGDSGAVQATIPVAFFKTRWPTGSTETGILIISDDEDEYEYGEDD